jgi:hypothetical protein
MSLIRQILILLIWGLSATSISAQTSLIPNLQPDLKEVIRAPDTWELIIETRTEDHKKVLAIMTSYRKNGYEKLQILNGRFCKCSSEWNKSVAELNLPVTAAFIPLTYGHPYSGDCSGASKLFTDLASFQGKKSEFIDHLRHMWGDRNGFNDMLYDLRISIRLIENLDLPNPCEKKTHRIKNGETLYRLSVIYGASVESIQEINNMGASTEINSGSVLRIP